MSVHAIDESTVKPFPAPARKPTEIVAFVPKPAQRFKLMKLAGKVATRIVPPAIVLAFILTLWEIACSSPGASLPPPSQVWIEAYDLIVDPFFNYGSQDIGLAWRVLTSLQRVWKRPVEIHTVFDGKNTLVRYDGKEHAQRTMK